MTRTVAILQARTNSSRLPGKVLRPLLGKPIVAHVIARALRIPSIDTVCLATSIDAGDDELAEVAQSLGAQVIRGPLDDVRQRFLMAAAETKADVILRITCDCPVLDPEICQAVISLREQEQADYASNVEPSQWPHGLDCECFTIDILKRAAEEIDTAYEREHVTPWIRTNTELKKANLPGPGGDVAELRWTLDYPEDAIFFERLSEIMGAKMETAGWKEILDVVSKEPVLKQINQSRVLKRS